MVGPNSQNTFAIALEFSVLTGLCFILFTLDFRISVKGNIWVNNVTTDLNLCLQVNETLLRRIVTPPPKDNYMYAKTYSDLQNVRERLRSRICTTPRPVPTGCAMF